MSCTRPLTGWKLNGRLVWERPVKSEGVSQQVVLPCGQCMGCRLSHSQMWAARITHEAQLYAENAFITLTYSDDNLPQFGSLNYPDFQRFMKRLRKALSPKKIRFFMCGEYGDTTKRAHYHLIVFGWSPSDGIFFTKGRSGNEIFTSALLDSCWRLGIANFSYFEPGAAEYIARYVTKKITGEPARDHYMGLDLTTGEVGSRTAEFARMSRRPGVGAEWFNKYFRTDVDWRDAVVSHSGMEMKVPRYYDKLAAKEFGDDFLEAKKRKRIAKAKDRERKDSRSLVYRQEAAESNQKARLRVMSRSSL